MAIPVIRYRGHQCSKPIKKAYFDMSGLCWDCDQGNAVYEVGRGLDRIVAVTPYLAHDHDFAGSALVLKAKRDMGTAEQIARAAATVAKTTWPDWTPDAIVPCPSSPGSKSPKSFRLGQGAGNVYSITPADILQREDTGGPRSRLSNKPHPRTFAEVLKAIKMCANGKLLGRERILLIDDMVTQGVTGAVAAFTLRQLGATEVRLAAFGRFVSPEHLRDHCD